jgi:hypothetical protein
MNNVGEPIVIVTRTVETANTAAPSTSGTSNPSCRSSRGDQARRGTEWHHWHATDLRAHLLDLGDAITPALNGIGVDGP